MRHNWKQPNEADEAWELQSSVAVVVTALGSIYDLDRPEYEQRWDNLVDRFLEALESLQEEHLSIKSSEVSRHHYATAPWATGGPFPELTEVITLVKSVNDVVQDLSGWVGLGDLMRIIPLAWARAKEAVGEAQEEGARPPLISLPGIKAICITDMLEHYGIEQMPQLAVDSRHFGRGAIDHPTWESRYCVLARVGRTVQQTFLYLLSGEGLIVEKMRLDTDDTVGIWFLALPEVE